MQAQSEKDRVRLKTEKIGTAGLQCVMVMVGRGDRLWRVEIRLER